MKPFARVLACSLTAILVLTLAGCGSSKKTEKAADPLPGDPNALPVVKDQKGKMPVVNTGGDK